MLILHYEYDVTLSGARNLKGTVSKETPVSAQSPCQHSTVNLGVFDLNGTRIGLGYSQLTDKLVTNSSGIESLPPPGTYPLNDSDNTLSVGDGGEERNTFGPISAQAKGSLTVDGTGSGKYEITGWQNAMSENLSGTIRWTCTQRTK